MVEPINGYSVSVGSLVKNGKDYNDEDREHDREMETVSDCDGDGGADFCLGLATKEFTADPRDI